MPEVKKTIKLLSKDVEVTEVPITKSKEPWSEYELEDGSVIRFKSVPTSILRLQEEYTPDGGPAYMVLSAPIIYVVSSPDHLRKKP